MELGRNYWASVRTLAQNRMRRNVLNFLLIYAFAPYFWLRLRILLIDLLIPGLVFQHQAVLNHSVMLVDAGCRDTLRRWSPFWFIDK